MEVGADRNQRRSARYAGGHESLSRHQGSAARRVGQNVSASSAFRATLRRAKRRGAALREKERLFLLDHATGCAGHVRQGNAYLKSAGAGAKTISSGNGHHRPQPLRGISEIPDARKAVKRALAGEISPADEGVSRATTAPCNGCAGKCAPGVDAMARSAASSSSVGHHPAQSRR